MKNKTGFSQYHWAILNQILHLSFYVHGNENNYGNHDVGHITKMAAMPIYGKPPINSSNSSSLVLVNLFPRNLVCSMGNTCPS